MQEQARNKYRELSNKEENIKKEYGRNRKQKTSKENKQILKEYQKNYRKAKKNQHQFFHLFFSALCKNETKSLDFW